MDSGVAFQYFASSNGVLRAFPAFAWMDDETAAAQNGTTAGNNNPTANDATMVGATLSTFDPRLTPWYARAVSGPKNVVVLIDVSTGVQMEVVRSAADSVLRTIASDDYVAVATFDKSGARVVEVKYT